MKTKKVVCFGEVLIDKFLKYEKIGGAPLNVAIRLNSLGIDTEIISAIGDDEYGKKISKFIIEQGLKINYIQKSTFQTGIVNVSIDEQGNATYEIVEPVAWDTIAYDDCFQKLVAESEGFIYGSLAMRNEVTKRTLLKLLEFSENRIFDVNLRAPFYKMMDIESMMNSSTFIKFNSDELALICKKMGNVLESIEDRIVFISKSTNTKTICVTRGEKGAILFVNDKWYYNLGYKVGVVNTVGSGDSFLGALVSNLLVNEEPQKSLNFACALGAFVASKKGAMPSIKKTELVKQFSI